MKQSIFYISYTMDTMTRMIERGGGNEGFGDGKKVATG